MAKQIVILGGGPAGISTAHKLLKLITPTVKEAKITLVSESTHLYWNLAAVRAVVPGQISDDDLFLPVADGFAKYPASRFQFVIGKATAVDFSQGTVTVETSSGTRSVPYDQLVLATGSSVSNGLPFKHIGSAEATTTALHELQSKIKKAKSIVIAGSGPTGVETMGELAHAYGGQKDLTLVVAGDCALQSLLPSVGKAAETHLVEMKVILIHNATVTDATEEEQSTSLTLSNGKTLNADLYIPLFGVTPNTSFLPPNILDDKGNVKLDRTLRVAGMQNVWAVGDVGNIETKQLMKVEPQVKQLVKNLGAALAGNPDRVVKYVPSERPMIFVTIGKSKGTGQMGGMKAFSWMVSYLKGRTLLIEKAPSAVTGG